MNARRTAPSTARRDPALAKTVYMLTGPEGRAIAGPLLGKPELDLGHFAGLFRSERYAAAEAKGDDWCFLSDEEFVDWLLAQGVLEPMPSVSLSVDLDTDGSNQYVPKHWPACPACHMGRGDAEMGRVLHGLNRAEWFRQCTACGHTWDRHDEPYDAKRPMLEDDGRYIEGGCVPYAISQAGSLAIAPVLDRCRAWGWTEGGGMSSRDAIPAARELGVNLVRTAAWRGAGKRTLRRVLDALPANRNYIVATKDHWLAVVCGENRDQADTSMRAEVEDCWEVIPSTQGAAA